MTTIFSTVTAEVSVDLQKKFPADFDFYALVERVSRDAGVLLCVTGQHYKFQGLWLSMGKVYNFLTNYLALHGTAHPLERDGASIENGLISEESTSKGNQESINGSQLSNEGFDESNEVSVENTSSSDNHKLMKSVKNGHDNEDNGAQKSPQSDLLSTNIPPKRKRGRPKKNPMPVNALSVVKTKMYKFSKSRSNFVCRPLRLRSDRCHQTEKTEKTDAIIGCSDQENLYSMEQNVEENDIWLNKEVTYSEMVKGGEKFEQKKKKRGRPRLPEISRTFSCTRCDYICENATSLIEHKQTVHKQCPTKCDICLKIFPNKRYMIRHRVCHVKPQHCCDLCGKMYKVKKSMEEHRKTHDDGYKKPVVDCPQCSKQFCNTYILKCHVKSEHLGEKKSFLCSICGKSFTTKHSLQEHFNAHKGLKPHICDICGKGFNYESALRDHKFIHTEGRRFTCKICNKTFCQRSGLKLHMQIHAVKKKFVCSECGRGFTQKQALERHERVHKGFKPFTCKLCRRTFTDSSIVRRHLILVHKIHKDSNSWREDIISKINATNFRVEKIDPAKIEEKLKTGEEPEVIAVVSDFQAESTYNYETKMEFASCGNSDLSQIPHPHSVANDHVLSNTSKLGMPQALDYSDRGTLSNNAEHIDPHNNQEAQNSQVDPVNWDIANSHCNTNHNNLAHIHPSSQQHNMAADHMQLSKEYPQTAHLLQAVNSQYIHGSELDTQTRCVNYPGEIRPDNPSDSTASSSQWTSIYAYYSQLASQFGMNFNDYQQSMGYTAQENLQDPSQPHT